MELQIQGIELLGTTKLLQKHSIEARFLANGFQHPDVSFLEHGIAIKIVLIAVDLKSGESPWQEHMLYYDVTLI